jgi:hypothetical protein
MGVWLGKQMLGQRDIRPIEFSGPNGQSAKLSLEILDEILSYSKKDT